MLRWTQMRCKCLVRSDHEKKMNRGPGMNNKRSSHRNRILPTFAHEIEATKDTRLTLRPQRRSPPNISRHPSSRRRKFVSTRWATTSSSLSTHPRHSFPPRHKQSLQTPNPSQPLSLHGHLPEPDPHPKVNKCLTLVSRTPPKNLTFCKKARHACRA